MSSTLMLADNCSVDLMKMVRSSLETIRNMVAGGSTTEDTTNQIQQLEQLEQLLMDHVARLDAINTVLEEFNYSVAHELLAPLRRISGFTQEIKKRFGHQMESEGVRTLESILVSTQQMNSLIEGLMQLSRLAHVDLQMEPVDLSGTVSTVAGKLAHSAPERKVVFCIEPQLQVTGDASLLMIAMQNLLDNAWKFTVLKDAALIEFGKLQADSGQLYYVRDNGVGFDMSHYGRLFHPFQRLHDAEGFSGNGIGLTAVKRIIERHGGRIWAEGEREVGATFFFTL